MGEIFSTARETLEETTAPAPGAEIVPRPEAEHRSSECTCSERSKFVGYCSEHLADMGDVRLLFEHVCALRASPKYGARAESLMQRARQMERAIPLLAANAAAGKELESTAHDMVSRWRSAALVLLQEALKDTIN